MEIFPDLEFGLLNGWLLVAIFYLVFGFLLVLLPKRDKVLAEDHACLQMYGESYSAYVERVPRYFLLL